ncbi:hypothetical protein NDU88_002164 [Pleurodeles waltl]|uniref:Uncharacterized protein n=1 Tax=Pleurodeles waltl TaxID=8319 RepID=A0AAV7U9P9_PLEWA|nr:hypothetical protein NDU88_002164 [Pleurodeles waltl]
MPKGLLYLTNTKTLDDSDGPRAPVESSGSQTQRATLITRGWRAGQVTPTFPGVSPTSTPPGGLLRRKRNHSSNSLERRPESSASDSRARRESRVVGVSRLRPTRVHGRLVSWPSSPASVWRCSRGRAIGVTRCPDDRGAGVSDVNPDFRVRKGKKERTDERARRRSRTRSTSKLTEPRRRGKKTRRNPGQEPEPQTLLHPSGAVRVAEGSASFVALTTGGAGVRDVNPDFRVWKGKKERTGERACRRSRTRSTSKRTEPRRRGKKTRRNPGQEQEPQTV